MKARCNQDIGLTGLQLTRISKEGDADALGEYYSEHLVAARETLLFTEQGPGNRSSRITRMSE